MSGLVLGAWVLLSSGGFSTYVNVPPAYFHTEAACRAAADWRNQTTIRNLEENRIYRCFPTGVGQ